MSDQPEPLRRWHTVVASKDPALLDDLLADDVVFRSPAVFAPQEGKALTTHYLSAAVQVLGPSLRYTGEWYDAAGAVLEFEANLDGSYVQGVDILRWNAAGKLVSVTVMARPLRGLQKLVELMAAQLGAPPGLRAGAVVAVAAAVTLGQGGVGGRDLLRVTALKPLRGRLLLGRLRGLELRYVKHGMRVARVVPDGDDRADVKVADDLGGVQAFG